MVPMLFDVLFIIALVAPVLAVCLGPLILWWPAPMKRPMSVRHDIRAHA
jgi:hypothetical protein